MASDSSPICFRLTAAERTLLQAVADYQGETLSAFVRNCAVAIARRIVEREGADVVLQRSKDVEHQRARRADERFKHFEEQLREDQETGRATGTSTDFVEELLGLNQRSKRR